MGQSLAIPKVIPNDWKRLDLIVNKIKFNLGRNASPVCTGLTLTELTASTLIGADADKALESVTIGAGLDYTRPTLSLSHLGIELLADPSADRILFWDDSETACKWLTVSTGLQISATNITTKDSEIVHDNLSGFVADEHIAHSEVTITAGTGLTGGGDISASRTLAVNGILEDLDTLGVATTDGQFIVATGIGTLAWESGATARTSIGLGNVENVALSTWVGSTNITTVGTIATGTWEATDVGITHGGTGQSTQQGAINALTNVSAATNEHVLTKDTATGNAIWKEVTGDNGDESLIGKAHDCGSSDVSLDEDISFGGGYSL